METDELKQLYRDNLNKKVNWEFINIKGVSYKEFPDFIYEKGYSIDLGQTKEGETITLYDEDDKLIAKGKLI